MTSHLSDPNPTSMLPTLTLTQPQPHRDRHRVDQIVTVGPRSYLRNGLQVVTVLGPR